MLLSLTLALLVSHRRWFCVCVRSETRPPLSISLAAQIGFHGYCSDDDSYQTSLKRMFESRLEGHLSCADRESPFFVQCWIDDVSVTCPSDDAYRKRRQTVETEVVVVILANITYVCWQFVAFLFLFFFRSKNH